VSRRPGSPQAVAPACRARALLAEAARALTAAGIPTARPDAEWLLADLLGVDRVALYAGEPEVGEPDAARYAALVARRAGHEPLQHLLGWEEFRGLRLRVAPAVLIPRPETELLVEWALALTPPGGTVADVGTGSGCIACALVAERPDVRVIASDGSSAALAVAAENVRALGLEGAVTLRAGECLEPLSRTAPVDLLVSNPPYIPSEVIASLPREVREWEPRAALDGGEDGMTLSRRIIAGAPAVLRAGGALLLEIGEGQAEPLATAMILAGFRDVSTRRDLRGVERLIAGRVTAEERD
jgi:release factor glutamine methyltransferase